MPWTDLLILLALGLTAGVIGGLIGIGGSIVIIPVLTLLLGRDQHFSQASAMIINVFVAAAAVFQHNRAHAIRWKIAARMVPAGLLLIIVGVEVSNALDAEVLKKIFGVFLLYVVAYNVVKLVHEGRPQERGLEERADWGRVSATGGAMGLVAGLLGIGGGPVAIPLLQRFSSLPLRQSIATSSAVMVLTATVGAARKNLTLVHVTDEPLRESILTAACLAPTAVLGALIGAWLTHHLPVRWVRVAFTLLMIWASLDMLGIL
ncbi:MAG: sulfite exporter TauE/SafE family protein [Planctomycetota bacterium]